MTWIMTPSIRFAYRSVIYGDSDVEVPSVNDYRWLMVARAHGGAVVGEAYLHVHLLHSFGCAGASSTEEKSTYKHSRLMRSEQGALDQRPELELYDLDRITAGQSHVGVRLRELEVTGSKTLQIYQRDDPRRIASPGHMDVDCWIELDEERQQVRGCFCSVCLGGASGSGGSRARDREDGDDTRGEDGGDDTNFFRKKSGNAAVQAVYKKLQDFPHADNVVYSEFPQRHVAGDDIATVGTNSLTKTIVGPLRGERFAIEPYPSTFPQRHFAGVYVAPSDMSLGERVECVIGKASNVVV
ncbi:hypothetical protein Tco_0237087 [Tanacetum coccineum]